jgi:ADP-heptose:LPS heptosyltransferase
VLPDTWRGVRRVLAVRLDNIGDVIMLGPALRTIRKALPSAHLALLASPAGAQAAPLLPWIDDVITRRVAWQDASGAMPQDAGREIFLAGDLRAGAFDAAVVFTSFSQSPWPAAYACYLAGIPRRIGQSKEFGGSLLTRWVRPPADCTHQVDRNLHVLEACGFDAGRRDLAIAIPRDDQAAADGILRRHGLSPWAPFIAVAPAASCPARTYPADRFAAALSLLDQRVPFPIVLLGGARDAGALEAIRGASGSRRIVSLAGLTSVAQMAGIIHRARLLVANNSGPLHLGDALRCPMVLLYSGTDLEEQWRPRSARAVLLRRPTPCEPCYRFECPYHMECLDIPPAEVVEACEQLLDCTEPRRDGAETAA